MGRLDFESHFHQLLHDDAADLFSPIQRSQVEVRGRIVPSELSLTTNWAHQFAVHSLYKNTLVPRLPEKLSGDDRALWFADWHQSESGRTAARLLANHTVEFAADGSFSVHGVLPGEYRLNLVALPRQRMTQTSWDTRSSEWSGKVRTQVLIPEADSVSTNNNVDLGELEMTIQRPPPK